MEGAREAMSQIIIQQEDERQLDTIRARVIEWSSWRQGQRKACRMQTEGSRECWNHQKCTEVHKDVQRSGNWVAEVRFEYFCPGYVSKNGVSVMECNTTSCNYSAVWISKSSGSFPCTIKTHPYSDSISYSCLHYIKHVRSYNCTFKAQIRNHNISLKIDGNPPIICTQKPLVCI